jgi:hypothetical protein
MANLSERFQELVGDSPCWYPDYRKGPHTAFYFESEVRSLAQHFSLVYIGARALHVLNLIWFGRIALLSPLGRGGGEGGIISSFKPRIPDPKTATKERGGKNFVVITFEPEKKTIRANLQRIVELFTPKIVIKLSKIWVWDPGSEIRDQRYEIRNPGSGIRDPRSGIWDRDPGSGTEIRKNLFRIPGQKGTGSRIHNTGVKHASNCSNKAGSILKFSQI